MEALLAPLHLLVFSVPVLILFLLQFSEELLFPCSSPATLAWYSVHWVGPFLSLEENQPALLSPSSLQSCILWNCSKHISEAGLWSLVSSGSWTLPSLGHYSQGCSWPLHLWLTFSKYEYCQFLTSSWDAVCVGMLSLMPSWVVFHTILPLQKISEISSSYLKGSSCAGCPTCQEDCLQMHTDLCSFCSSHCTALQRGTQMWWFPRKCMRFSPSCLGEISAVWGNKNHK